MTKTDDLDQLHKIRYHVAVLTKNENISVNKKGNYISYKQKKAGPNGPASKLSIINKN